MSQELVIFHMGGNSRKGGGRKGERFYSLPERYHLFP